MSGIAGCWTGWALVASDTPSGATILYDLGIDTASDEGSLAVFAGDSDQPLAVRSFRAEGTMTRTLLGEVASFLESAGVERRQVGRIAVTVGPGQYGSLRAGIAVAQGMAVALDIPLAGVGRLQADAARVEMGGGLPVVAVHLTRTGPAWAAFERQGAAEGAPREIAAPMITSYAAAAHDAPYPAIWTGELDGELRATRDAAGRTGDTIADSPDTLRAVAIVRIARAAELFGDPASVDAVYLRPPPITRPREQ